MINCSQLSLLPDPRCLSKSSVGIFPLLPWRLPFCIAADWSWTHRIYCNFLQGVEKKVTAMSYGTLTYLLTYLHPLFSAIFSMSSGYYWAIHKHWQVTGRKSVSGEFSNWCCALQNWNTENHFNPFWLSLLLQQPHVVPRIRKGPTS